MSCEALQRRGELRLVTGEDAKFTLINYTLINYHNIRPCHCNQRRTTTESPTRIYGFTHRVGHGAWCYDLHPDTLHNPVTRPAATRRFSHIPLVISNDVTQPQNHPTTRAALEEGVHRERRSPESRRNKFTAQIKKLSSVFREANGRKHFGDRTAASGLSTP